MRGVITHISAPKSRTDFTTTLKNIPVTLVLAASPPSILDIWSQIFQAFLRFPTNAVQLSPDAVNIQPKYLKGVTVSRGLPYV